jgi:acyl carrier protein
MQKDLEYRVEKEIPSMEIDNLVAIKEEVADIISKVARIEKYLITETASLKNELLIDSIMAIQIVSMIEDRFNIEVEEIEIFNVTNLKEIVELVIESKEKVRE